MFSGFDGVIVTAMGDGVFAAFSSADAAARACVEAQRRLASTRWPGDEKLQVRMGLHTAEAEPQGDNYISLAVHQAARVGAAGHGGQIVASDACVRDLSPSAALIRVELGVYRLKDFDLPERLWQIGAADLPLEFPALRVPPVAGHNLRIGRTSFVGRDKDVAELRELIGLHRLVTVIGPGGVGKSRLSTRVGAELTHEFADGVWGVGLVAATDRPSVLQAMSRTLGVPERSSTDPTEALTEWIGSKTMLLVVDNCEHVLDATAAVVDVLLDTCPNVRALATSREALHLSDECRWTLRPLPVPPVTQDSSTYLEYDAVRLFIERATAVDHDLDLSPEVLRAASDICRLVDGLPIAIELAAAQASTYSLPKLSRLLEDSHGAGLSAARADVPHHQTLHALVDWSYRLLSPSRQAALCRLALFTAGFSMEAVQEVLTDEGHPIEDLAALVEASLVQRTADGRYYMLETIRQFCLASSDVASLASHSDAVLRWAKRSASAAENRHTAGDLASWTAETQLEHDNWLAMLRWAVTHDRIDEACALARSLWKHFFVNAHHDEGIEVWQAILTRLPEDDIDNRVDALTDAGALAWSRGRLDQAQELLEHALAVATAHEHSVGVIKARIRLGALANSAEQFDRAEEHLLAGLDASLAARDRRSEGLAYLNLGVRCYFTQQYDQGEQWYLRALPVLTEVGELQALSRVHVNLADIYSATGAGAQADSHMIEALALGRTLDDPAVILSAATHLARAGRDAGNLPEARQMADLALTAAQRLNDSAMLADAESLLAELTS